MNNATCDRDHKIYISDTQFYSELPLLLTRAVLEIAELLVHSIIAMSTSAMKSVNAVTKVMIV